jgi:hypothetical protein
MLTELKCMKLLQCEFLQMDQDASEALIATATNRWLKRKVSNFNYLIELNKLAGRTYNDLGQYPIFLWVIADDQSPTFRNLGLPLGALSRDRLNGALEHMENADRDEDRCLYQSFHSSQAVVVAFLIRIERFASLYIELQSGRFDGSYAHHRALMALNAHQIRALLPT